MATSLLPSRRARSLTTDLEQALADRIRDGRWAAGTKLPREADLIDEFQVSRTVVREAISRLQAAGMVETRHGVGSFVMGMGDGSAFQVRAGQMATLRDVVDVLELRIAVETESAGLAAARRTEAQLAAMRSALDQFAEALAQGRSSVGAGTRGSACSPATATARARRQAWRRAFGPAPIGLPLRDGLRRGVEHLDPTGRSAPAALHRLHVLVEHLLVLDGELTAHGEVVVGAGAAG